MLPAVNGIEGVSYSGYGRNNSDLEFWNSTRQSVDDLFQVQINGSSKHTTLEKISFIQIDLIYRGLDHTLGKFTHSYKGDETDDYFYFLDRVDSPSTTRERIPIKELHDPKHFKTLAHQSTRASTWAAPLCGKLHRVYTYWFHHPFKIDHNYCKISIEKLITVNLKFIRKA